MGTKPGVDTIFLRGSNCRQFCFNFRGSGWEQLGSMGCQGGSGSPGTQNSHKLEGQGSNPGINSLCPHLLISNQAVHWAAGDYMRWSG